MCHGLISAVSTCCCFSTRLIFTLFVQRKSRRSSIDTSGSANLTPEGLGVSVDSQFSTLAWIQTDRQPRRAG